MSNTDLSLNIIYSDRTTPVYNNKYYFSVGYFLRKVLHRDNYTWLYMEECGATRLVSDSAKSCVNKHSANVMLGNISDIDLIDLHNSDRDSIWVCVCVCTCVWAATLLTWISNASCSAFSLHPWNASADSQA